MREIRGGIFQGRFHNLLISKNNTFWAPQISRITFQVVLVQLLRELCAARVGSDAPPAQLDHIVLETSGLADPGPIVETIRTDPMLVHHIKVTEIVVAVDALHGLDQLRREPLNRPQIETADRLVVTKLDRASRSGLGRLLATLRVLNPGAALVGAIMGSPADLPDAA